MTAAIPGEERINTEMQNYFSGSSFYNCNFNVINLSKMAITFKSSFSLLFIPYHNLSLLAVGSQSHILNVPP